MVRIRQSGSDFNERGVIICQGSKMGTPLDELIESN